MNTKDNATYSFPRIYALTIFDIEQSQREQDSVTHGTRWKSLVVKCMNRNRSIQAVTTVASPVCTVILTMRPSKVSEAAQAVLVFAVYSWGKKAVRLRTRRIR